MPVYGGGPDNSRSGLNAKSAWMRYIRIDRSKLSEDHTQASGTGVAETASSASSSSTAKTPSRSSR
jgi:hypothetical protein